MTDRAADLDELEYAAWDDWIKKRARRRAGRIGRVRWPFRLFVKHEPRRRLTCLRHLRDAIDLNIAAGEKLLEKAP